MLSHFVLSVLHHHNAFSLLLFVSFQLPHFPEVIVNLIIDGVSHKITPENNTGANAWEHAINANGHEDSSKSQTEHLKDFSTWTDEEIQNGEETCFYFYNAMGRDIFF